MAKFNYIAVDSSGKEVRGSIEAPSQAQAVAKIRDKQLFPTAIGEAGGGGGSSAAKGASKAAASGGRKASKNIEIKLPKFLRPKVKTKDLTTLTRQLATLVGFIFSKTPNDGDWTARTKTGILQTNLN